MFFFSYLYTQNQNNWTMKKYFLLAIALLMNILNFALFAQQTGKATYYANRFHGKKTASGKLYHKDSLTCAHKTYPLGTLLEVFNPNNGKSVVVEVTDRGPHARNKIIDLSLAAARQIEITRHGVATVEIREWESKRFEPLTIELKTALLNISHYHNKLLRIDKEKVLK